MSETTIRGGADAVSVETSEHGVRIALGPDGVDASVVLDPGEARELAEAILDDLEGRFGQEDAGDDQGSIHVVGLVFDRVVSPELDLIVLRNPSMWPRVRGNPEERDWNGPADRIFVKRWCAGGRLECGMVWRDEGSVVKVRDPRHTAAYDDFEAMVRDGWRLD